MNHAVSAGKMMEVDKIVEIFKRSTEKHDAKYAYHIGNGNMKILVISWVLYRMQT